MKKKEDPRTDQQLVRLVRLGKRELFGIIFERHNRIIYGELFKMVHDHQLVEDLVQDTFETALKYLINPAKPYDFTRSHKAWLRRIAENLCISVIRKNRKRLAINSAGELTDVVIPCNERNPEERIVHKEQHQMLRDSIHGLTRDESEVVLMRMWGNMKFREIAPLITTNENTVKARFCRARDKLALSMAV